MRLFSACLSTLLFQLLLPILALADVTGNTDGVVTEINEILYTATESTSKYVLKYGSNVRIGDRISASYQLPIASRENGFLANSGGASVFSVAPGSINVATNQLSCSVSATTVEQGKGISVGGFFEPNDSWSIQGEKLLGEDFRNQCSSSLSVFQPLMFGDLVSYTTYSQNYLFDLVNKVFALPVSSFLERKLQVNIRNGSQGVNIVGRANFEIIESPCPSLGKSPSLAIKELRFYDSRLYYILIDTTTCTDPGF